jgi:hypothetical protein
MSESSKFDMSFCWNAVTWRRYPTEQNEWSHRRTFEGSIRTSSATIKDVNGNRHGCGGDGVLPRELTA